MNITNIKITEFEKEDNKVKAYVSFVLNESFAIHDVRIIEGINGLFVAMPSRKTSNGFKDVCHPIVNELREEIDKTILNQYDLLQQAKELIK